MKREYVPAIETLESRTFFSVGVAAAPVSATPPSAITATPTKVKTVIGPTLEMTAGVPFNGRVGFYASPILDPPLRYGASINWGDGVSSQGVLGYGASGTQYGYFINGSHTYAKPGTHAVVVTFYTTPISPKSGLKTTIIEDIVDKAIVAKPTPNSYNGVTIHEVAGDKFTADLGTFITIAPATNLSAAINWGDGSTSKGTLTAIGIIGVDEIKFKVTGTHTYGEEGRYPIHIVVSKPGFSGGPAFVVATIDSTAVVVKPVPNSPGGVTIQEEVGKTFTADLGTFITLAPATNLSATISWGDGTSSKGVLTGIGIVGIDEIKFKVTGTHLYEDAGKYQIHIVVYKPGISSAVVQVVTTIDSTAIVSA